MPTPGGATPVITPRKPFTSDPPSEELKAHFQSTWAWKYFQDPNLQPMDNESRFVKTKTSADTFISRTLATDETIKAWQSFKKGPDASKPFGEMLTLVSLGSGVNGHVDTSHGGFVSVLHDEALGLAADHVRSADMATMTAYLRVDYKKPLMTPSVNLCRAWVEKTEGRKIYVRGTIEDGDGNISSLSEALFIIIPRKIPRENL